MVDTVSADIQQSNVSIHTSAPEMCVLPAEYLRYMTPETQRTDVLGRRYGACQAWYLSETRKPTGILETLSLEPVLETALVVMETHGLVLDGYGLVLDDCGQPMEVN